LLLTFRWVVTLPRLARVTRGAQLTGNASTGCFSPLANFGITLCCRSQ
jgi:hypothetical protein